MSNSSVKVFYRIGDKGALPFIRTCFISIIYTNVNTEYLLLIL